MLEPTLLLADTDTLYKDMASTGISMEQEQLQLLLGNTLILVGEVLEEERVIS